MLLWLGYFFHNITVCWYGNNIKKKGDENYNKPGLFKNLSLAQKPKIKKLDKIRGKN